MQTMKFDTTSPLEVPLLFLVFNRPDETRRVFEAVRAARPLRLFIAQDGPRPASAEDRDKCARVRDIVQKVDWDCEVRTLFREDNLGCGDAVAGAIDWFFSQVSEGIVLEDDCLPSPDFFGFCRAMLDAYRDDPRVMSICGHNFLEGVLDTGADVFFSRYTHVWGWATWKRAWAKYDRHMASFPQFERQGQINNFIDDEPSRRHWLKYFRHAYLEGIDTWDFQWIYSVLVSGGLCAFPRVNLISNIGFHEQTNQFNYNNKWHELPLGELREATLPDFTVPDRRADRRLMRLYQHNIKADNNRYSENLDSLYWFDLGPRLNYLHPDSIAAIPEDSRVAIYGFGQTGFELLAKIEAERPDVRFVCWVDTYRDGEDKGRRIVKVDDLDSADFDTVIIASIHYLEDIERRLAERDISNYFIYAPFERLVRHYYEKNLPSLRSTAQYDNNLAIFRTAQQALGIMNWQDPGVSGEGAFLERYLAPRETPLVLDAGGHRGEYAKLCMKLSPGARVYSFEPNPAAFAHLEASAARRGFTPLNLGCSDAPGKAELHDYTDDPGSVHASLHKEVFDTIYGREASAIPIELTTVDLFARELGLTHVDLLKIDTEGHEMRVLEGARETIRTGRVDAIHFEFNDMNVLTRVFLKDFLDFLPEYEFFRMLPDGLVPLGHYDARTQEIFSYQNIVALLREGGKRP